MQDEIIKDLKEQISKLQKQVDELQDCSFKHFDEFTKYICEHSDNIGELYRYTLPMFDKLFPGYVPTAEQIEAILKRAPSRTKDGSDKKNS